MRKIFKYQNVNLINDLLKELPMALSKINPHKLTIDIKDSFISYHFDDTFRCKGRNNINQPILNIAWVEEKKELKFLNQHSVQHNV